MEKKTIGSFIAVLRKARGMTQQELADQLYVSNKSVSRWERDETSPDLSLIPVIAELFGVSTDELLQGSKIAERGDSGNPLKNQKQIETLLKRSISKYQSKSIVAALLVIIAMMGCLMSIYSFHQMIIGIGIVASFCAVSIAYQAISFIHVHTALSGFDSEIPQVKQSILKTWNYLLWIIYLNIFAAGSAIPLWVYYKNNMMIMDSGTWFHWLIVAIGISFIVCFFISILAPKGIIKKESLGKDFCEANKRITKLKLVCFGIAVIMISVTGLVQNFYPWNSSLAGGTHFNTFEEFKEYAETPVSVDENGEIIEQYDPNSEKVIHYNKADEVYWMDDYLQDSIGNTYKFTRRNRNMSAWDYDKNTMSSFTV
jgi:Predicted transcriptional regulators